MSKTRLVLAATALPILIVGIVALLPPQTRTQPASASQGVSFDHSNCQYPERWSNPADGCDNSDPAVPECIKAALSQESEQACIAAFIKKQEPPVQPAPTVNECEAK